MSKAREIAEERFARGEISEEELRRIISRLDENPAPQYSAAPVHAAPAPAPQNKSALLTIAKWVLILLGLLFAVVVYLNVKGTDGLEIANITLYPNEISLDIANSGSKKGDIIVYAQNGENGTKRCPHIFEMRKGTITKLTFPCSTAQTNEQVFVYGAWADSLAVEGLRNLASRIELDWDKEN